jgi:hypothetical protein
MEAPVIHSQLVQELKHDVHAAVRHVEWRQRGVFPWPILRPKTALVILPRIKIHKEEAHGCNRDQGSDEAAGVLEWSEGDTPLWATRRDRCHRRVECAKTPR